MEDKERTLYCGNLSEKVTEDLLYELFLQAGPLENVIIPKDKEGRRKNFGFITFKHAVSVPYSVALMSGTTLYGKLLRLDPRAEVPHNPYLEQLKNYGNSVAPPMHLPNDNRSRRHDSRRFEPRIENDTNRFDSMNLPSPMNLPGMYPVYPNQPCIAPMNFQQNLMHGASFPPGPNMYPHQWNQFR